MSTVGQLCADDIGTTEITVEHQGASVTGVLTDLRIETERNRVHQWGGLEPKKDIWTIVLDITIGSVTLRALPRDHPMEVVS